MSDNYQAVFDAVRSKFSYFDGQDLTREIASRFDISFAVERVMQDFRDSAYELSRPSTLLKPKLFIDGDKWCALYGENLQCGVAGFGTSPVRAMLNFDYNYRVDLK